MELSVLSVIFKNLDVVYNKISLSSIIDNAPHFHEKLNYV